MSTIRAKKCVGSFTVQTFTAGVEIARTKRSRPPQDPREPRLPCSDGRARATRSSTFGSLAPSDPRSANPAGSSRNRPDRGHRARLRGQGDDEALFRGHDAFRASSMAGTCGTRLHLDQQKDLRDRSATSRRWVCAVGGFLPRTRVEPDDLSWSTSVIARRSPVVPEAGVMQADRNPVPGESKSPRHRRRSCWNASRNASRCSSAWLEAHDVR